MTGKIMMEKLIVKMNYCQPHPLVILGNISMLIITVMIVPKVARNVFGIQISIKFNAKLAEISNFYNMTMNYQHIRAVILAHLDNMVMR